jgi:hypothetical protein
MIYNLPYSCTCNDWLVEKLWETIDEEIILTFDFCPYCGKELYHYIAKEGDNNEKFDTLKEYLEDKKEKTEAAVENCKQRLTEIGQKLKGLLS